MKKTTDEIPIDIILYNAIKYCPSPININLNLTFGAQLSVKTKKEALTIGRAYQQISILKWSDMSLVYC